MAEKRKILLAVDGSAQSLHAVRYAARTLSPAKTQITLMHVSADLPEAFMDVRNAPSADIFEGSFREWSQQRRADITAFMQQAVEKLAGGGFEPRRVQVLNNARRIGYARDILEESQNGYAALIVGRHGLGCFDTAMIGSVAAKLAEAATHVPLAIVGGNPGAGKCIVAFDPSESAKRCVTLVASLFDVGEVDMLLCHIVRPLNMPATAVHPFFKKSHESDWVDINTRKIIPDMVDGKRELIAAGMPEGQFATAILKEKTSRAESVFAEARLGNRDTIVIGRRGVSAVEDFSMGRVCRKLLHMATEKAVWII